MRQDTTITTREMMIGFVVVACAVLNLWLAVKGVRFSPAMNTDFLAFWSFPRFAAAHPVAGLYDAAALQAFQQKLYPGFHSFYPFLYPPAFLLVGWWLKFFSFAAAEMIWTLAGLALLAAAVWCYFKGKARWLVLAALLASPASLLNWATGETAYFTTALLLFGFAALRERKILAGVAFGLLTLKPQLGVLVPFALLAQGEWRVIMVAGLVAMGLAGLSCLVFPPGLWLVWARMLPVYQAQYFASHGLNLNIIVTPAANLVVLGVRPGVAWVVQMGLAGLVAGAVFWRFRQSADGLAVAVLLAGSFLAVPHAYAYDSMSLTVAMAMVLLAGVRLNWALLGLGVVLYLAPLVLLSPVWHWFLYAGPEMLLFGCMIMMRPARIGY